LVAFDKVANKSMVTLFCHKWSLALLCHPVAMKQVLIWQIMGWTH